MRVESSLPPTPAQSLIKLNQGEQLVAFCLSQVQFGCEQIAISVESVELRIHSAAVPQISQSRPVLQGGYEQFLLRANLFDLAIIDKRVRDLPESVFDRLLILRQRQLTLRFGASNARSDAAGVKDRQSHLGRKVPGAARAAEEVAELTALPTHESRQTDLRKVSSLRHADVGGRGHQILFRGADVRAPFEQ